MWKCKSCGEMHDDRFDSCWNCGSFNDGTKINDFENIKKDLNLRDEFEQPIEQPIDPNFEPDVIVTTAPSLEGYKVIETIDIVTAEFVIGMDIFADFFASLSDVFGGRSKTTQKALRNARKTCLREMKIEAYKLGANAVIAVDLDYSEFSGQGKSMLFLVASGTAVKVETKTT